MKLSYLKNKSWTEVTRDERFFCAHLYFDIKQNLTPFLNLLKDFGIITDDEKDKNKWDIGYEVCFYRDFIYRIGYNGETHIGKTEFHNLGKRTFDLCLFSETKIIIIEAKAQQGFDNDQMDSFIDDKERLLPKLIGNNIDIKLIGLISSEYHPVDKTRDNFNAIIDWKKIWKSYPNQLYLVADALYRK